MLKNQNCLENLDFFEELDERVSEVISGGASIKIDLTVSTSGITDTIINLDTSNIDRIKDVEVSCLNRECTVKANGKKTEFTLPKSSSNLDFKKSK